MKSLLILFCSILPICSFSQEVNHPDLRSILLEQLKTTHNVKDWFVPANLAIANLTPEQANWKDSSNHSIAQLTTHLIFWNLQSLKEFNGTPPGPFSRDNTETFAPVTGSSWAAATQQLDSVLTAWEAAVQNADDAKLQKWASRIAHIGTHNAYHTGQILYIRKMKGWWNDKEGVQ